MWRQDQRHILIVCALGQELHIVKSVLKWHIFQWIQFHYHICGVGLEKSMIGLTEFLSCSELKFELIINIWIVGFAYSKWSPLPPLLRGKVTQCFRIIQWDAKKELCVPPQYVLSDVDIVPLTSRYRVVRERSQLEYFLQYEDIIAVDMEWYSIESVCDYFWCPRMFLKVLYDEIGKDDIKDYNDMLDTMKTALWGLPELLRKIL